MTDKLIRITTALAVAVAAAVAAMISYRHAYELVRSHGQHRGSGDRQLLPYEHAHVRAPAAAASQLPPPGVPDREWRPPRLIPAGLQLWQR